MHALLAAALRSGAPSPVRRGADLGTRAGVAVVVAMVSPILIGVTGFTVDVGMWYTQQISLQTAADAAALKAARDLATNAATTTQTLNTDALAAANAASPSRFNLNAGDFTLTRLAGNRQVQVDIVVPGAKFFSSELYPMPVALHAGATAGVDYPIISRQATCYSIDSYNYLYSTGFGTIDTAHVSGIDPFKCGGAAAIPSTYNQYCNGGVLGCTMDLLGAGNFLLPFALQLGPNGAGAGVAPILGTVTQTLNTMLGGNGYGQSGTPTVLSQGSPQCPGNVCTVAAGVYNGGLTIGPNLAIDFVPSGNSHSFLIENGDLTISTQDRLAAGSDGSAMFFFGGATPGGYIAATQVQVNTAPLNNGAILLSSTATFTSSSTIGTQTSAPMSSMQYAQTAALTQGLLSILGTPGQNLVGTNFESVVAVCPDATTSCANPQTQTPAMFQSTILPAIPPVLSALLPTLTPVNLLSNEGESSSTTVTSGVTFANGVPTDWSQSETANSTLTNTLQTVPGVLASLGVSPLLTGAVSPLLATLFNAIAPNETAGQATNGSGVFTGQTTAGAPSCAGQPILYSNTIAPAFSPGFTDILNSSSAKGAAGAATTSDSITVCGNSEIAAITPISPGTIIVASTAGGSSTITLLK